MKKLPYERQEGETKKAFEAFTIYRDLGITRSIREVAQKLNKSVALIGRWSSKYNWVERCQKFDDEMDRRSILENEKKRREMVKRHANASSMFQAKVIERLNTLKPEELSPNDLIKWFTEAVKIERISRGESTDISEVTHNGEVKEKHEYDIFQQIDQYADLYEKLANRQKGLGRSDASNDN